ncbi:MAG: hypothetical protein H0W88_06315 [Parachlamydiaceae bacterium]|nr:hypothetical protein [Parachlamydiaceae bacterium]
MRFILNFFFFGILFYLIYLFFPEAFHTLVSWADKVIEWLKEIYVRIAGYMNTSHSTPEPAPTQAFLLPLLMLISKNK